jgi:hypothetical protein
MNRPEGVRIVHADGTADLCELAFERVDDDGDEIWSVLTKVDFRAGDRIEIEHIPAHTGIEFPLVEDPRRITEGR